MDDFFLTIFIILNYAFEIQCWVFTTNYLIKYVLRIYKCIILLLQNETKLLSGVIQQRFTFRIPTNRD